MKAKDIRCRKCGGSPEIYGQDDHNVEGPFFIACTRCGKETFPWAYQREAWANWKKNNIVPHVK